MDKLVSVIIPTMNREKELKKALESVFAQTHQNLEIIIIDNSDCDYKDIIFDLAKFNNFNTNKICYIHLDVSQRGFNSSQSRNIGIKYAKGEYIAFLDDDDVWIEEKLEKQLKEFEKYEAFGLKLVICFVLDKRFYEEYVDRYDKFITESKALSLLRLSSTSSYLFKSDILKNQIVFDEAFPSAQEYELALRTFEYCNLIVCVQEVLVIQNKSKYQITYDWKKKRLGLKMLWKKHSNLYMKYGIIFFIKSWLKIIGVRTLYLLAEIFGKRIYKIIIPMKKRGFK